MRPVPFTSGEFYHLYNRGVDKRRIFMSPAEYRRFIAYLFLLNDTERRRIDHLFDPSSNLATIWKAKPSGSFSGGDALVAIGAYCLMPNHFHLYVTPVADDGISKFMQRLQTAYTMYFNEKYERSGALFQGTFKAEHVDNDIYAKYLFSYIHLNPAKLKDPEWKERGPRDLKELREFVGKYPYSSLGEYRTHKHMITNPKPFPHSFSRKRDIDDHINDWILLRGNERLNLPVRRKNGKAKPFGGRTGH
jgi:putative transposase